MKVTETDRRQSCETEVEHNKYLLVIALLLNARVLVCKTPINIFYHVKITTLCFLKYMIIRRLMRLQSYFQYEEVINCCKKPAEKEHFGTETDSPDEILNINLVRQLYFILVHSESVDL